jgi:hypothetical protein
MSSIARLVAGAGLCIAAALAGCRSIRSRPTHPPQAGISRRPSTPSIAAASYEQSAVGTDAIEADATLPELRVPTKYDDRPSSALCTKRT